MRRFIRDAALGVGCALIAALAASLGHADLNTVLIVGIVVCAVVIGVMEVPWPDLGHRPPLKVKLADHSFDPLSYAAELAALEIRLKNRTGKQIRLPGGYGQSFEYGDAPQLEHGLNEAEKAALVWETAARERSRHYQPNLREPVTVPARSTMTVWVTEHVSRTLTGARPGIKVSFSDDVGNGYSVSVKPRGPARVPLTGSSPPTGTRRT